MSVCPVTIGDLYTTAASESLFLEDSVWSFRDGSGRGIWDSFALIAEPAHSPPGKITTQPLSMLDSPQLVHDAIITCLGIEDYVPTSADAPIAVGFGPGDVPIPTADGIVTQSSGFIGSALHALATASGTAHQKHVTLGSALCAEITAVGVARQKNKATGAATTGYPTATGTAKQKHKATGAATTAVPTAAGTVKFIFVVVGAATTALQTAEGYSSDQPVDSTKYKCFVVNADTLSATEYDIEAIDVANINGVIHFLTPTGIVALDPSEPSPAAHFATGELWFTAGTACNVERSNLLLKSDGPMTLTATVDRSSATAVTYPIPERTGAYERSRSVRMGRGARGNDWQLRIDSAGGEWRLQGQSVLVEQVERPR